LTPGFNHHPVADNHRDLTVPDRQVTGTQRTGIDRGTDILFLRQPRNSKSRFVIRPLCQTGDNLTTVRWLG
jgi:hypothetical protein